MKNKIIKLLKNSFFLTTIITLLIYICYLIINKIFPFGENTILKNDQYTQFVDFLCYYKEVLLGRESLQLSWYMGLGTNFYTTFAYYLASPLNLISIFFNNDNMYICVEIITCAKIVLIACFMIFYIKNVFKVNKIISISFSVMYAFSAYVVSYSFNIMWMDALYILPIIAYMIEKYINNGKVVGYTISLAIALFINYYIGYMLIIFSFIYFFSKYILKKEKIRVKFKNVIIFFIATILAIGMSMITILPSVMQVSSTTDFNNYNIELFSFNSTKIKMLTNQIFNSYSSYVSNMTSNFFSGTLTTISILLYLFNDKIKIKEKLIYVFVLIFMILPIFSPILNKIWHGMTITNGYGYRFSFITSFFLIYISLKNFENIQGIKKIHILFSVIILTILSIVQIIAACTIPMMVVYVDLNKIIIAYIVTLFLEMFIFILNEVKNIKSKNIINICIIITVVIDIIFSIYKKEVYPSRYYTISEYNKKDSIVEYVKTKLDNNKFDRIEFIIENGCENLGSKYQFSTIQYFTSARNLSNISDLYNLGYNAHKDIFLWTTSKSGNYINYTLTGSKYYITEDTTTIPYGFELIEQYGNYKIYENKNAFSIAYMVDYNFEKTEEMNSFELQKNILKTFDGSKEHIYKVQEENKVLISQINNENGIQNIKIKAKDDITICINTNEIEALNIQEEQQYKNAYKKDSQDGGIKEIAYMNKGDEITFSVKNHNNQFVDLYAINNKEVQDTLSKMKENNQINNIEIRGNSLEINNNYINSKYLVFSIPYDKGWKAYVDNKEVPIEKMYNAFMKIKIEDIGLHSIKLQYQVPYLKTAFLISLSSSIIVLLYIIKIKKEK